MPATITTATKATRTLIAAATSNAAGGTTNSTVWADGTSGSVGALSSSPGVCTIVGAVANGGTGPTAGAAVTVNVMVGGTIASPVWRQHWSATFPTTASTSYPFEVDLPPGTIASQVVVNGNTGQAVACEAFGLELTSFTSA